MPLLVGQVEDVGVQAHVEQEEAEEPHKDELDHVHITEGHHPLPQARSLGEEVIHR